MINVLSYIGMGLQSEVCLWTLLGLMRTIFDATLFKVNANLKQVWQMSMPVELSLPVQRVLRTMISGIMLVQCFTVYLYLASYIVLLYPVFLEERPILVLPWLLLAAIRKLLCELTSLALGLGSCVLLGPARPPCIKFVVIKVISIMPSFYMWMLVYSYYHVLKVASVFKTFPAVLPTSEHDYGLELAIRRRRAKSLLGEDQLRKRLISNFYNGTPAITNIDNLRLKTDYSSRMSHATDTNSEDMRNEVCNIPPVAEDEISPDNENTPVCFEDWLGREVMIPRGTDRILEQFTVMMLRIGAYLTKEDKDTNYARKFNSPSVAPEATKKNHQNCTAMPPDAADTPPLVGTTGARTASYLRDYPLIFQKKTDIPLSLCRDNSVGYSSPSPRNKTQDEDNDLICKKWSDSLSSEGSIAVVTASSKKSQVSKTTSERSVTFSEKKTFTSETEVQQVGTAIGSSIDHNNSKTKDNLTSEKDEQIDRNQSHSENVNNKAISTSSNQTINASEIKTSSITSLRPNDEQSETNNRVLATSTHHTKPKSE